jgi:hypothetical protein
MKECEIENIEEKSNKIPPKEEKTKQVKQEKVIEKKEKISIENTEEHSTHKEYLEYWPKILDKLKSNGKLTLSTNLLGTKAKKVSDTQIEIEFFAKITAFARSVLEQSDNKSALENMVKEEEGRAMRLKFVEVEAINAKKQPVAKSVAQDVNIAINIIDE